MSDDPQREFEEFERIRLTAQMDKDRALIAQYRANEQFYINRLVEAAEKLGRLNERLSGGS